MSSEVTGAYKVNRMITETHLDEIAIIGSSRAEGGFIPDSLGSHYFNYGLSGSKYDVALFFLSEECKKKKNNPWVLINLDLDGIIRSLGDIANYIPNAGYPPAHKLIRNEYKSYYSIPVVKYYGLYESYLRDYLNNKIQLTKFTNKGAAIEKKVLTDKQFNELVEQRRNSATSFEQNDTLVHQMDELINSHPEKKFIFVISPYHNSFFEQYTNPDVVERFMAHLRSLNNVYVFDFGKMPLPDSLFFNTSHLNYKGAVAFNRILRDSLNAIGVK